jgi:hypothetical protein
MPVSRPLDRSALSFILLSKNPEPPHIRSGFANSAGVDSTHMTYGVTAIGSANGVAGTGYAQIASGTLTVTCTDNATPSNTYNIVNSFTVGSNFFWQYWLTNIPGNPTSINFVYSRGTINQFICLACHDEFSTELGSGKTLNKSAMTSVTVPSSPTSGPSVSTSSNGELIVPTAVNDNSAATRSPRGVRTSAT